MISMHACCGKSGAPVLPAVAVSGRAALDGTVLDRPGALIDDYEQIDAKMNRLAQTMSAFSQAWASWRSAPGVALLAVVAFAVGIGAATAIYSVINGVLLRPLPYPSSERLVALYGYRTTEVGTHYLNSVPDLQDYARQTTSFDVFGWFRT